MDAASIIADWKRQLVGGVAKPPYVYRDTPRRLIEKHHQRLTTFLGYPESEIAATEARLGVRFPDVFRTYLLEMGRSPGDLFRGSHLASLEDFEQFRADALELTSETDPTFILPPQAVVFLFHQGYTFVYLAAAGGFDSPPMQWTEGKRGTRQVAPGFAEMVGAELGSMERNDRSSKERGGYYLKIHPGGGTTETHPARTSGERPLDHPPAEEP